MTGGSLDCRQRQELVFGEATRYGDFTDADINKMSDLSNRLNRKGYLAFSTLKDSFSVKEKELLNHLTNDGHKVIALTREELDPYDLHKRFENTPHKFVTNLRDFSENTSYLNLK